jgi:hypothetical protein
VLTNPTSGLPGQREIRAQYPGHCALAGGDAPCDADYVGYFFLLFGQERACCTVRTLRGSHMEVQEPREREIDFCCFLRGEVHPYLPHNVFG